MVLSPEEFALAQVILTKLQNTTNYSYNVLIEGTRTESLLNILAYIFTIALSLLISYFTYRYVLKFQKENSYNDTSERIVGPTIMFVVSLIFIGIILSILVGILMGYILPEYTIITKLMNMGMSGCS